MSLIRKMDKEKMVHILNEVLLNCLKNIMKFTEKWMELDTIILSEVTKTRNTNKVSIHLSRDVAVKRMIDKLSYVHL